MHAAGALLELQDQQRPHPAGQLCLPAQSAFQDRARHRLLLPVSCLAGEIRPGLRPAVSRIRLLATQRHHHQQRPLLGDSPEHGRHVLSRLHVARRVRHRAGVSLRAERKRSRLLHRLFHPRPDREASGGIRCPHRSLGHQLRAQPDLRSGLEAGRDRELHQRFRLLPRLRTRFEALDEPAGGQRPVRDPDLGVLLFEPPGTAPRAAGQRDRPAHPERSLLPDRGGIDHPVDEAGDRAPRPTTAAGHLAPVPDARVLRRSFHQGHTGRGVRSLRPVPGVLLAAVSRALGGRERQLRFPRHLLHEEPAQRSGLRQPPGHGRLRRGERDRGRGARRKPERHLRRRG